MTTHIRDAGQIAEHQSLLWQIEQRAKQQGGERQPVVTISKLPGARGEEVGRKLAASLHLDFFDREIIHQIAESAHLSDRIVSSLDERNRSILEEWLGSFSADRGRYLSPYEYLDHLRRVVGAIARHGGAVILGRGAHLILERGQALRVLVVAPREARVATLAAEKGLTERDSRARLAELESGRRAFVSKHFHQDADDVCQFDLVVNTAALGVEGAVAALAACVGSRPAAAR